LKNIRRNISSPLLLQLTESKNNHINSTYVLLQEEAIKYIIKLIELHDQHTLTMRAIYPVEKLPEFFGIAYGGVMAYLQEFSEAPAGIPFGVYHNLDMSALDVEAGFPVARVLPGKGEISASIIPGGKYTSTTHIGSYDSVQPAYDALTEWAKKNGYEPSGIAYEYYLNNPTANPDIIPETEIRFPVKLLH
jgi:effector-binding domain-containing protein